MAKKEKEMKPEETADDEGDIKDGMKRGGKAKKFKSGGKVKKEIKAEGGKAKAHMGKPAKKASGGSIDSTDEGVTPSRPFAIGSPQRSKGGKC